MRHVLSQCPHNFAFVKNEVMFENNVFNVNAGIAEALKSLKVLKALVVRLQQYEYAAKLRDIEKNLESAAEHIDYWRNPLPPKGLTPKGKSFYKHLFNYCAAIKWENKFVCCSRYWQRTACWPGKIF